jgi:hypothetical protein
MLWVFAVVAAAPTSSAAAHPSSDVDWGIQVGLLGQAVVGNDVTGPQGQDEFDPNLSLLVEPFVFEWARAVELAPYFAFRFAGGFNEDVVDDALTEGEVVASSFDYEFGAGVRVHPWALGPIRPTLGVFGAYALSVINVGTPEAPPTTPGGPPVAAPTRTAREAFALGVGLGARTEGTWDFLGARWILGLEGRYTQYFWSGLETSVPEALGPRDLDVHRIGVLISTGLRFP